MAAIPVNQFVQELTNAINEQLAALPDDTSRQQFLDALSGNFFGMPYANESIKIRS